MEIKENIPIMVFDNQCYLCMKFAKFVNFLARGKMTIVGHYTDFGEEIRDEILDESALEMFWFIDKKRAYGGRAAILPLLKSIFLGRLQGTPTIRFDEKCQQECKTVRAVFLRSSSLLTNSKKIDI